MRRGGARRLDVGPLGRWSLIGSCGASDTSPMPLSGITSAALNMIQSQAQWDAIAEIKSNSPFAADTHARNSTVAATLDAMLPGYRHEQRNAAPSGGQDSLAQITSACAPPSSRPSTSSPDMGIGAVSSSTHRPRSRAAADGCRGTGRRALRPDRRGRASPVTPTPGTSSTRSSGGTNASIASAVNIAMLRRAMDMQQSIIDIVA